MSLLPEIRTVARSLIRSPGYSLATVAILALGIGANAAIFSIVHTVLLRPLPYPDSERIVRIWETYSHGKGRGTVSAQNLNDWREQADAFEAMASYWPGSRNLMRGGEPERLGAYEVSASLFQVLGAQPVAGRLFGSESEQEGAEPVALITESAWRDLYGGDPQLIGGAIELDGVAHTVLGVLPATMRFPPSGDAPAFFLPHVPPDRFGRGNHYLSVLAKLRSGRSLEAAQAQLEQVAARLEAEYPDEQTGRSVMLRGVDEAIRGPVRDLLRLIFGAVALVLAIACANLAGLALARATGRQREVAVRAALGASRLELARPFLTESVALALAGAALGALVAQGLLGLLAPSIASSLPNLGPIGLDRTTFTFLLAIAVVTGVAFGVGPALLMARRPVASELTESGLRATGGRQRQRSRRLLVTAQLALSLTLLLGAGLLLRTFFRLQATPPGFDRVGVLTVHLSPARSDRELGTLASSLLTPVLENLRAIPGVESAGMFTLLPIQNWGNNTSYSIEGLEPPPPGEEWWVESRAASPGAFESLGVPLRAGRALTEVDGTRIAGFEDETPPNVVVNEAFVRRHFPDGEAIGRRVRIWDIAVPIVGVVGDVRQAGLDREPLPELSVPYNDPRFEGKMRRDVVLVVRTTSDPSSILGAVRAAVRAVDPAQPLHTIRTLDEVLDDSLGRRRLTLLLTLSFALVALLLAATGIYALIAYLVAQRRREIGLRMALGATAREIGRWVMSEGVRLAAAGIALGLAGGWGASRLVASQLHEVSPLDPWTWTAVVAFVLALALGASLTPALRAARTQPSTALRDE